ncbi:helicase with zinc finger domain 2 [Elysia marginata]|uniref:Helicase with zinc finger domain 2 n=1 Tax=Elysia marginata TaxID=1093978 RepID=A0AAV4ID58_9GAST|nr:helicase with zinc finger domain 2 [Elysia marginata]
MCLHCVALMLDTNRSYFHISSISVGPRKTQKYQNLENMCQEWVNQDTHSKGQGEYVYRVKVVFKTDIYGTFRQSIVFDFGVDAVLMREVQVESAPASDAEKVRKEITLTEAHRWNEKTVQLVNFDPRPASHSEAEQALMAKYQLPRPEKFCQPETVMHSLSKENYRLWMHEMLYIEEMEQVGYISRFNVTTSLQLVNRFLLMPSTLSTAKYAHDGELFARMKLEDDLSEDSMGGRLVLQSSHVAWVAEAKKERPEKVYEAVIEDKGKNFIFMRLSKTCVDELGLSCDQDFNAQIQFQLNRLPMCERHYAVDRLPTLDIVFPQLNSMPAKLALDDSDLQDPKEAKRLNDKQKDAVRLILAKSDTKLPPLLIVGPFGTGKTFTMAQAAKQVLNEDGTRILICTHSNSAADLYIKEFLHSYVDEEDHAEARPLRIMYKFRWIQTVPEVVLDYTLLEREGPHAGTFRPPTVEDVMAHRIIIATLSSARYLADLKLPEDAFSHIFIDEAAQSLESETLIPLSVAHENTRIVFAGDHMQMSPEVYSDFTRQQGFHTSLLERLHELYPKECVYKVMLCENYRAHAAIIDFTSELFYDNKLISSGNIVAHHQFYPLTFFAAKGEEIQHENNTGFYNMSEVYEIVERVDELKKKWPEAWGAFDNNGVSIVAPYIDQVARIRSELRKRKLFNVNVERVLNVQGKQYRVIILSITRTRLTCRSDPSVEEITDFGFLSNIKLLNTAITRAQSLVMVVGDPVSVCLVGKCRKIWEYFLEICHYNDSLHGISWVPLREQLDRAELTKSFVLNPLAPEFVPSRLYHSAHAPQHVGEHGLLLQGGIGPGGGFPPHPHSHPYFGGYPAGYPGMMPGQPFPQMIASMYQPPVYFPYNPGFVPAMYYPPSTFSRGLIPNKQMFGRYMAPPAGSATGYPYARGVGPVRDGLQRIVEMPRTAGVRQPRGRHSTYYPRGAGLPGFSPGYHQPLLQPPAASYLYQLPEDPRAFAYAAPQAAGMPHPFLASPAQPFRSPAYSGVPRHHYTGGPSSAAAYQPYHGYPHASPSPQTLLKGAAGVMRERSDTADSGGSGGRTSESPSSLIQLLPNVKHVPAHLIGRPDADSDLSQHTLNSSPVPTSQHLRREAERAGVSQRPYSPANYAADRAVTTSGSLAISRAYSPANFLKEKASSGDEGASHNPASYGGIEDRRSSGEELSGSHHSSHDRSMSLSPPSPGTKVLPQQATLKTAGSFRPDAHVGSNGGGDGNDLGGLHRRRPNLKLHTGFSRQFSDDLPTPTVITNVFQMIDDNIEESQGEEGASSSSPVPSMDDKHKQQKPELKLKMSVAQRLQRRQLTDDSDMSSSSATPPSGEELLPSYASMVTRVTDQRRDIMTVEEAAHLDLQTPRTPKGFITPGTEVGEIDPLGILKSLNIGSTHQ